MKYILFLSFIFILLTAKAQDKPTAINLADIAYPVLTMKKSPSAKYIFLTLSGGRFLLYDIARERLNENSLPIWKNMNISGFEIGGDAEFSSNEEYILVSEQNALYAHEKLKIKPFKICVLQTSNGNVIFETNNVNNAQFLNDNETLLLTHDGGIATYNIRTKIKGALAKIDNCEIACLNKRENILAVSYDPESTEFRSADGAGENKKEVRNAVKHKRLITFYNYPEMTKSGTIKEEIDIVFKMQFTADDNYLLFFSRTGQAEHTNVSVLNGMDKANDLNQFQRINMLDLTVDNLNFIHQTSNPMSNFDVDLNSGVFVYGDNRGFLSGKQEVVIADFNNQNAVPGKFTFQGRTNSRNVFSPAFSIIDASNVLVANKLALSYWDFKKLPIYVDYIDPVDNNAFLEKAIEQLDNDLQSPQSELVKTITKKKISGLFLLNITIQKGGEVVSVFALSDEKTNISMQNALKDIMLKYRFNIAIPKNERIKFAYTFNL